MQKETDLSIKKNKLLIFIFLIVFILILIALAVFPCPIKFIFSIPCPGCGIRRSLIELAKFNLLKSLYFNILTIPLIMLTTFTAYTFFKTKSFKTILNFLDKHYIFIIIMIILSEVHNIVLGI